MNKVRVLYCEAMCITLEDSYTEVYEKGFKTWIIMRKDFEYFEEQENCIKHNMD